MADCERALGLAPQRHQLAREADRVGIQLMRIEMIIVEAGARRDLGQDHEARRILERTVVLARPEDISPLAVARLRYAYADALLDAARNPRRASGLRQPRRLIVIMRQTPNKESTSLTGS